MQSIQVKAFFLIHIKQSYVCYCFQAQVLDLRSDLYEVRATKSILEKELHNMLLQLHTAQLQLHAKSAGTSKSSDDDAASLAIKKKLVSPILFQRSHTEFKV